MTSRQKPEPTLSINRFITGLFTQRNPLTVPFSYVGLNMVQRNDALINGLNCDTSNSHTAIRRGGFPRYCSQGFAGGEVALTYWSARLNGQVIDFVDTNLAVYTFTPSTLTLLFTKSAGAGQTFFFRNGNKVYFCNGVDNKKWCPPAKSWGISKTFSIGEMIIDPNGNIQQVTAAVLPSTSGFSQPTWSTTPITGTTGDGNLQWTCRGNQVSNWGIVAPAAAPTVPPMLNAATLTGARFWAPNVTLVGTNQYSIIDSNGNVQLMTGAGTTGSSAPQWSTIGNGQTNDGGVTWACQGPVVTWSASTAFQVPSLSGAVIDTNGNLQVVAPGGTSGTTPPTWNATISDTTFSVNGKTTDNTIVWHNIGNATILAFRGYQWCFAFHTCYGHVGTASPLTISTNTILGGNGTTLSVTVNGFGSAEPQCDAIWIFRIADGGSVFELAGTVANPGAGTWSFTDNIPDSQLNNQILAPLAHLNDPPPAGMTVVAKKLYQGRVFGAVPTPQGNFLAFNSGSDAVTGVKEEAWAPANLLGVSSTTQNIAPTSQGLLAISDDTLSVVMGGPTTLSFFVQDILTNFGISNPNCMAQDADQLYFYTTQRQLWSLTLSDGKNEDGFAVGDILALDFDPTKTYLALHRNGPDSGLFVSDGSTNAFRYALNTNSWSTIWQPVGGIGAMASVETAPGVFGLMAARPSGGFILRRSLTAFNDDGQSYAANGTIGSLVFSEPGTPVEQLASIVVQQTAAGAMASIGVLLNEISGTFTNVPQTCSDPAENSGTRYESKTVQQKRYDLNDMQTDLPNVIRHMQMQWSWPAEDKANEILGIHFCPQV